MHQKKFFLLKLLTVLMILFVAACVSSNTNIVISPEFSANSKLRVAVLEFDCPEAESVASVFGGADTLGNTGINVADQLAERMMTIPGIRVIGRSRLNSILKKKNIPVDNILESGYLDEIARIAGIDAIVTGSVGNANSKGALLVFQESTVSFTARCVRVSDGAILWSGSILSEAGSHNITKTLNAAVKQFAIELDKAIRATR